MHTRAVSTVDILWLRFYNMHMLFLDQEPRPAAGDVTTADPPPSIAAGLVTVAAGVATSAIGELAGPESLAGAGHVVVLVGMALAMAGLLADLRTSRAGEARAKEDPGHAHR